MKLILIDSNVPTVAGKIVEHSSNKSLLDCVNVSTTSKVCQRTAASTVPQSKDLNVVGYSWCTNYECLPITKLCAQLKTAYTTANILLYNTPLRYDMADLSTALSSLAKVLVKHKQIFIVYLNFVNRNEQLGMLLKNLAQLKNCIVIADECSLTDVKALKTLKEAIVVILKKHNCHQSHIVEFVSFVSKCMQKYRNLPNLSLGSKNALLAAEIGIYAVKGTVMFCDIYEFITAFNNCNSTKRNCLKHSCAKGLTQ